MVLSMSLAPAAAVHWDSRSRSACSVELFEFAATAAETAVSAISAMEAWSFIRPSNCRTHCRVNDKVMLCPHLHSPSAVCSLSRLFYQHRWREAELELVRPMQRAALVLGTCSIFLFQALSH